MFRRVLLILLILSLFSKPVIGQEEDFNFANWPISGFENRAILSSYSDSHFGVDVAAGVGEKVEAASKGKVYWTYSGGSHGVAVGIEHENGWRTTYLHLSERFVKKGQQVKAGEVIGEVGTTGTGRDVEESHLHFSLIVEPKASIESASKRYANPMLFSPTTLTGNANVPTEENVAELNEQSAVKAPDASRQQSPEVRNVTAIRTQSIKQENALTKEEKQSQNLAKNNETIAQKTKSQPTSILTDSVTSRIEKIKSRSLLKSYNMVLTGKRQSQKNINTSTTKKNSALDFAHKGTALANQITNYKNSSEIKSTSEQIAQKSLFKLDRIYIAIALWLILVLVYLLVVSIGGKKKLKLAC